MTQIFCFFPFQVLASFGMFLSDEQFNILVTKLSFNNKGHMHYTDFVNSFDDPRVGGPGEDIQRSGNHRVNPIKGDQWGMTIDEVEKKLASKLRENFAVSFSLVQHYFFLKFILFFVISNCK